MIKYKINILIFDSSNYQIVSNFPSIFLTCKAIKQQIPECLIILSGRDPSFFSKQIISAIQDIDIVIKGEMENTLKELISVYLHGGNIGQKLYDILGITFRSSKNLVIQTKERPFVKNLDELPYPSYDALNIDSKTIAMIASARGCPFSCNFCYKMSRIVRTLLLPTTMKAQDTILLRDQLIFSILSTMS